MCETVVRKAHIWAGLRAIGVLEGDICLFHSSFKSFGSVEGGAETVIAAFESVLGPEGTLVVPTLCSKDFENSYQTWHMDKPSDCGYLTEYFRKQANVLRSDHATHSVAARGKEAYSLTFEHGARGPHMTPFGEYAFSDSSPWAKMYERNAKIVFVGVTMMYNTMKHFVERRYVEWVLSQIPDEEKCRQMTAMVKRFDFAEGVWPYYNSERMQTRLEEAGLLRSTKCGNATLLCVEAKPSSDFALTLLQTEPDNWVRNQTRDWLRMCLGI